MSQYKDISTHRMHTICIHCTTGTLLCNCTNIPTYSMKGIMSNTDVMHAIAHTYWCPFQLQVIFPFRSLISRRVHKVHCNCIGQKCGVHGCQRVKLVWMVIIESSLWTQIAIRHLQKHMITCKWIKFVHFSSGMRQQLCCLHGCHIRFDVYIALSFALVTSCI